MATRASYWSAVARTGSRVLHRTTPTVRGGPWIPRPPLLVSRGRMCFRWLWRLQAPVTRSTLLRRQGRHPSWKRAARHLLRPPQQPLHHRQLDRPLPPWRDLPAERRLSQNTRRRVWRMCCAQARWQRVLWSREGRCLAVNKMLG